MDNINKDWSISDEIRRREKKTDRKMGVVVTLAILFVAFVLISSALVNSFGVCAVDSGECALTE